MNYVAFFAVLLPFELCVVVTALFLVRRKTMPDQPKSWLQLLGKVLLLLLVVNLVGVLPQTG